ncbi:unnamed protein product [Brassica napus]|uniref:(rape) hypothetical protein n=1 Tax=Brassica napus TaxID=3708 RepID=A0A816P631_BRANA|nr:unnamed protein product [Brassica napus]
MLSNRISISSPSQIKPCTCVRFVSGTEEKDTSCVVDRFVLLLMQFSLSLSFFLSQLYFKRQK